MRIPRLWRYAIAFGILTIAALLAALKGPHYLLHVVPFKGAAFEQAAWNSALACQGGAECIAKESACIRGPMYDDLANRVLPPGTSRQRVLEALGHPGWTDKKTQCWDYELGLCSGFKIDTDYLRACFDQAEKLTRLSHFQS